MKARPVIVGIRHHSPACARLAVHKIRTTRPAFVLIEGPGDFNERLGELYLAHDLPVAIYSYLSAGAVYRASWTPFLSYSPEWQGLLEARAIKAEVKFIDLPAWHDALDGLINRYADQIEADEDNPAHSYEEALGASLNISGKDALWDHLFESETDLSRLEKSLETHFDFLRGDEPGSPANQNREEMMARWVAWAVAQEKGGVLVICGGYHAKALRESWPRYPFENGDPPPPTPEPKDILAEAAPDDPPAGPPRFGSYLVPYSFKRLDSFQGYASGMPSPAFYQWLWDLGLENYGPKLLEKIFERLRRKRYPASTADLKSVHASALALAGWRGHAYPLRSDYLDALATGLIKTALDVPLPWSYRGVLLPGTDPVLVEVMDVLAGDQSGRLDPATPQPPLLLSVREELRQLELELRGQVKIDLLDQTGLRRSRCLHALKILDIPGLTRSAGPELALGGQKTETWDLSQPLEQQAALIEAGAWGATLFDAARGRIEARLREAGGSMLSLARILNQAALAGLSGLSARTLATLGRSVAEEQHFEAFGEALEILLPLWQHGVSLNMQHAPVLKVVLESSFDRMLWLLEPPVNLSSEHFAPHLKTHLQLMRLVRENLAGADDGQPGLDLAADRALAVWQRKAADPEAAPVSRGASLGALLTLRGNDFLTEAESLLDSLPPAALGDALMGLLALGREVLTREENFLKNLDRRIQSLASPDFTLALPALRAAFGWLPSFERKELARVLAKIHGGSASGLTRRLAASPEIMARAMEAEQRIVGKLARWGIFMGKGDGDERS